MADKNLAKRKLHGRIGGLAPHKIRTHWTKGKRRNDPGEHWPGIRTRLARALRTFIRGQISIKQCAMHCRVDQKTIAKYLEGTMMPTSKTVAAIESWLEKIGRFR